MNINSINWVLSRHNTGDYINEVFIGRVAEAKATQTKTGKDVTFCDVEDLNGGSKIKWTLFGEQRPDLQGKEVEFIPAKGKGTWIKLGEYKEEPQLDLGKEATWKLVSPGSLPESDDNGSQESAPSPTPRSETKPSHANPPASQGASVSMEGMMRGNLYIAAMKSAIYVKREMEEVGVDMPPDQFQACVSTLYISLASNFLPGKGFNDRKPGQTGVDNCLPEQFRHKWQWTDKEKEFFNKNKDEKPTQSQPEEPEAPESSGDEDVPF